MGFEMKDEDRANRVAIRALFAQGHPPSNPRTPLAAANHREEDILQQQKYEVSCNILQFFFPFPSSWWLLNTVDIEGLFPVRAQHYSSHCLQ